MCLLVQAVNTNINLNIYHISKTIWMSSEDMTARRSKILIISAASYARTYGGSDLFQNKSILLGFSVKKEAQHEKISLFISYAGTIDMKIRHRASRLSISDTINNHSVCRSGTRRISISTLKFASRYLGHI